MGEATATRTIIRFRCECGNVWTEVSDADVETDVKDLCEECGEWTEWWESVKEYR
jgi:hypothetical protein